MWASLCSEFTVIFIISFPVSLVILAGVIFLNVVAPFKSSFCHREKIINAHNAFSILYLGQTYKQFTTVTYECSQIGFYNHCMHALIQCIYRVSKTNFMVVSYSRKLVITLAPALKMLLFKRESLRVRQYKTFFSVNYT